MFYTEVDIESPEGGEEEFGKSQEGEEEELTITEDVIEAVVNDNREGKMWSLDLGVLFTCYVLLRNFYAFL